jgi:hypothetical protein
LLTQESRVARRLFEDFGIIKGYNAQGLPIYDEFFLCADPHERLYMRGRWQEGMVPVTGISAEVEAQYKRFFALMETYKQQRGSDGKKVFAIPVAASSQEARWLALDNLTMQAWMEQQGFVAEELRSAWAGIHYFAARSGRAANADVGDVLTWPEGNGWLANKLAQPITDKLHTHALVYEVAEEGNGAVVKYWDQHANESVRVEARAAIMAVPRFVAARLVKSRRFSLGAEGFSYAPWAVANITLSALPHGKEVALSWDNVAYRSPLLGYVVATHQLTQMHPTQTVLTYYWPLSHLPPPEARKEALARSYPEWQRHFTRELLGLHPELGGHIQHVDVWLWGHAMVRPTAGFIWGKQRREALRQHAPIFFAHSDMSGMSIFEEACTHGVDAAEQVLRWLL